MNLEFNIEPLSAWAPQSDLPLINSVPCSAESEEQVLETDKMIEKYHRANVY